MERLLCATSLVCLLAGRAGAQATPPERPAWPIHFSGLIDGYYSLNFNHPASRVNGGRNFDVNAGLFSLNMAKLTAERAPGPVGFRVDLGVGRAFEIVHGSETGPGIFRHLEQAIVSVKPAPARGLQVDFGKFVTSAGAEVIETGSNWNYSRSLLFTWAIPYYHFGLRSSMPVGKHFSAGVQLVNGWNNVEDNNSGKTAGLSCSITAAKFTWTHTYYVGPEKSGTNNGLRQLYDTALLVTPGRNVSLYLNFDYGLDRNIGPGAKRWLGIAGAARVALSSRFALAPRVEWFNDAGGFATGRAQRMKEATLTGEFKAREGILGRIEYRRDWSSVPFFDRGAGVAVSRRQPTLLAGVVASFGR